MVNLTFKLVSLLLSGAFVCNCFANSNKIWLQKTGGSILSTYIITDSGSHTSFDPLDADAKQNLHVMRMMYLTPLEMGHGETLVSSILENFSYKKEDRSILLVVKKGLVYEDGSEITVEDVAFAVLRMAFTRPQFPVLKEIKGIAEWAKSKNALLNSPSGISVNGRTIQIKLKEDVEHPLYRLALELFSIIPKKCVDISTNKLICKKPPESGYYRLAIQENGEISFVLRQALSGSKNTPKVEKIQFKYLRPKEVLNSIKFDTDRYVISVNESSFSDDELLTIEKKYLVRGIPKSLFSLALLSKMNKVFGGKACRQLFLDTFRNKLLESGEKLGEVEASITTQILPGYLSWKELQMRGEKQGSEELNKCVKTLEQSNLKFSVWEGARYLVAEKAMTLTLKHFKIANSEPKIFSSREEQTSKFVSGEFPIVFGSTGFWAQDPFGDLQMLFTPNLHKQLQFVASDLKMQQMIERLRKPLETDSRRKLAEDFNEYMYNQAFFGVYKHTRRLYLSPKSSPQKPVPAALVWPSPWHVFE
jgi:hypothetical protein